MKRLPILLVATICAGLSAAAQNTQKLTANKSNEYGLIYTLPLTAVDITVETKFTSQRPGEFANYANRHLGITDAVRKESDNMEVKSITINTRGIPNPANRWLAQFKSGATTSIILTDAGIPLAINTSELPQTAEVNLPTPVDAPLSPLETDAARQAVTLEMTRSTSPSKKAELAAQRIFELREQRNELISGNADNMPADGGALKVALKELDAQEAALTAMFAGTSVTYTKVQTFQVIPGSESVTDTLVARVSALEGLVDATDLTGAPLTMTIEVLSRGELPVNEKGEIKKFPKNGVAYTIPGTARITLKMFNKELATATVELAQLGTTFGLDPGIFSDRKAPMCATFSPVTGGIITLEPAH